MSGESESRADSPIMSSSKVFVIDDEEGVLSLNRSILERQYPGVEVSTFTDGSEAIAELSSVARDQINKVWLVVDLNMGKNIPGNEVIDAFIRAGVNPYRMILACSPGSEQFDEIVMPLQERGVRYLRKPFSAGDLIAAVRDQITVLFFSEEK